MKNSPRFDRCFRFASDGLNNRLIRLLSKANIPYAVDGDRYVYYLSDDEGCFEEVLARVRNAVFPSWQVLSSPRAWTDRYRAEMGRRGVQFQEEWANGSVDFLISREHRPHAWKLD